jgi:hypothetical protein
MPRQRREAGEYRRGYRSQHQPLAPLLCVPPRHRPRQQCLRVPADARRREPPAQSGSPPRSRAAADAAGLVLASGLPGRSRERVPRERSPPPNAPYARPKRIGHCGQRRPGRPRRTQPVSCRPAFRAGRAYPATRCGQLFGSEGTVLSLPFRDSRKPVTQPEGTPGSRCHPRGHAHALRSRCSDHLTIDIRIYCDRKLGRRVATWHRANYTTTV